MPARPSDLAAVLVARRQRTREVYARRAHVLRADLDRVVREAYESGLVQRAWLIGSLARGTFGAGSDVDVVVSGLPVGESGRLWGLLVDRLHAEVDLLRIEELPDAFARRVREEGAELGVD